MKPNRRTKFDQETKARIVTDYLAGVPIKEILKRYNIGSNATIYRILKEDAKS